MKTRFLKLIILYFGTLFIFKIYFGPAYLDLFFLNWDLSKTSILFAICFLWINVFKIFLIFEMLNFLNCLDLMIQIRTSKNKLAIVYGFLFCAILVFIDFLFIIPNVNYLIYIFVHLILLWSFVSAQIVYKNKNALHPFFIGSVLYILILLSVHTIIKI